MFSFAGYQLYQKLSDSQSSFVYRARRSQQSVILKIFTSLYPTSQQLASIKQEYEITRYLNSLEAPGGAVEGVVTAYDLFQIERWVMVLEDFGGDSLARLGLKDSITYADLIRLAINITQTIAQIHQKQVYHCDINPSNIVLNQQTGEVKLIDFGHATHFSASKPTFLASSSLKDKWAYISPEQTGQINREVDYRTDFYSLGITFYELLTGQLPFNCDNSLAWVHHHLAKTPATPHDLMPQIPSQLSDIVMKLMAKDPDERYQSASDIQTDLEHCLEHL